MHGAPAKPEQGPQQKRGFMVGQEQCDAKGFGGMHIWHGNLVPVLRVLPGGTF